MPPPVVGGVVVPVVGGVVGGVCAAKIAFTLVRVRGPKYPAVGLMPCAVWKRARAALVSVPKYP